MFNYEYIVISDLDGTLCNSLGAPSKNTVEYIREFQQKHPKVLFTFSTGRNWADCSEIYESLGLTGYISCLNGAYIYNPKTEHLVISCLGEKFLNFLLHSPHVLPKLHSGSLLTNKVNIPLNTDQPNKIWNTFRESKAILIGIKLLYREEDKQQVNEIIQIIKSFKPAPKVNLFYYPGLINLEIQNDKEDKFSFVKFAANYYGVDYPKILTFGDNYNDVPMMQGGVRGCALANATFLLKQEAQVISKFSNDEDGLIKELDSFFGPL
ncbi:HAD-IIB family hydrolase [Candidatus Mycoplasma haematominutum]|uniref:Hydrolase of the HAD superfamily n=1 Tax=Candidatus Mycoplasma haematominutum 'Birmingham 1' TaxID=1116213 RepID=G8C2N0_9MOLU|nr:HAD family hydrolase [Candidatus Mycoplasma haematominutum]CCE66578.1 hydrolase of the HAD superfamily [Candidatus Mycoplasma haematominutum 'Birmingham 1']